VRAGLGAAPYLLRRGNFDRAAYLLERAYNRHPTRKNAAAVLPAIAQVTARDRRFAGLLAHVQEAFDPVAAEATLRAALAAALGGSDFRQASALTGRLSDLCRGSGRLAEALALAEQAAKYVSAAGLGPWTRLSADVYRLQVLEAMGEHGRVLAEAQQLKARLDSLPGVRGPDENITPWNVREALLDVGRDAALRLELWDDAVNLTAAGVASKRARRAPATEIAKVLFSNYGPLLRLGRADEAVALLRECLQVFEDVYDVPMVGKVLSALASTENKRGHGEAAIALARDSLRYRYLAGDVTGAALTYHILGNSLRFYRRQPLEAIGYHLAAALLHALAGVRGQGLASVQGALRAAVDDLRELGGDAPVPQTVADLCSRAGDIPGTDLPALIARLSLVAETAEAALRDLVAQARALC
jgi:tetratricopeptide (TPR) repeat protein